MSTQKKVWMGVAVVAAVALLAVPFTAYANRQRAANGALTAAQQERASQAEAARWEAMGDYYQRQAAAAEPQSDEFGVIVDRPVRVNAEQPVRVYDATGAREQALEGAETAPPALPAVDWDAERARMTAMPGYTPAGTQPTAGPSKNGR